MPAPELLALATEINIGILKTRVYKFQIHLSHFNLSSLIHLLVVLMFFSGPTLGYLEYSGPQILCIPDSKTQGVDLESPLSMNRFMDGNQGVSVGVILPPVHRCGSNWHLLFFDPQQPHNRRVLRETRQGYWPHYPSIGAARLNNPSSLSRSSSDLCSRPFTSFVALLWTRSSTSMSLYASNPGKLTRHLIEGCLAYPNENQQLLALYWDLAWAYQATNQYYQGIVVKTGTKTTSENAMIETGTQTASKNMTVEIGTQTTTTVIAPVVKKKQWTRRSMGHQLVREEEEGSDQEAGPSAKKLEEQLEDKEAQQLGSLARNWGIGRGIRKEAAICSLRRQFLSSVRARYPFKEDLVNSAGKWTTADEGVQYLKDLAVLEVIYDDIDDNGSE
ncbi:hypothetical protein QYF61_008819 [Mycteria americana]|uniref:Uncharacterized protein n=1 Tax=Mycteria americana TaxID=33587 RepID=A0AAN7N910_MYCAM|nr:hypothetical protein QYF61_008819 [Mycteria americana]